MNLKYSCNLCDQMIHQRSIIHEVIEARVVPDAGGMPRLVDRGEVLLLHLCRRCGLRMRTLMTAIRQEADRAQKSA